MEATSIEFAAAARVLGDAARSQGLVAPSFRSPPRLQADRTIRRAGATGTVAVRVRGRPWLAVLADLVEGVVVVNRLRGNDADRCRTELWAAIEQHGVAHRREPAPARKPAAAGRPSTVDPTPGWRKRQTQAA